MNQLYPVITFCTLLSLAGCGQQSDRSDSDAASVDESHVESMAHEEMMPENSGPALVELLANPGRAETDQARDAGRKPAEVMAFLGVEQGMTAIDILAASGYYTEVLSLAVGDDGTVYAQNTSFTLTFRDGANDKAMQARLADSRLPNVARWDKEFQDLSLAANSVDVAITALNFHDMYHNGGSDAVQGVLATILGILKPGGILGIIDHVGDVGADNKALHRIDPEVVRGEVIKAGFVVDGESDILSSAIDTHENNVFGELRGNTDRFLFRLKKPEA